MATTPEQRLQAEREAGAWFATRTFDEPDFREPVEYDQWLSPVPARRPGEAVCPGCFLLRPPHQLTADGRCGDCAEDAVATFTGALPTGLLAE